MLHGFFSIDRGHTIFWGLVALQPLKIMLMTKTRYVTAFSLPDQGADVD
jgi:hypothetical protein